MAEYLIQSEDLVAIADKIRVLSGTEGAMSLEDMNNKVNDANVSIEAAFTALSNKGINIPDGANIGDMVGLISNIESSGSNSAIIDILELPNENINESAFYRLVTTKFVSNYYSAIDGWTCYYVNELPSVGEPVSADMVNITAYYNAQDGEVYGYADSNISAVGGIPVGWYPIGVLGQAFDVDWGGVITDADDVDDSAKVLLSKDFYIYQDGWCKVPFACEKAPEFDIQWDGVIDDRIALDMSMLGYNQGVYFVKVSDDVFTTDEMIGWTFKEKWNSGSVYETTIDQWSFDTLTYPGAFTIGDYIVVLHDSDTLAAALGIPSGIYTNGIYFYLYTEDGYVSRLTSQSKVVKIDEKYLPDMSVDVDSLGLHSVATSGNYNDLYNRPNLNNYVTSSQVQSMISNAIGSAIGGSY